MKAYKFRSWENKYEKALLTRNIMYFSSPKKFNDPFDFKVPIRYELESDEYLKDYFRTLYNSDGVFHNEEEISNAVKVALKKVRSPEIEHKQTIEKGKLIDNEYGVFSLSETKYHNLLWAHYANCHKGYCLEFDLEKLNIFFKDLNKKSGELIIDLKIEYTDEMPIIRPSMETLWDASELKYKSKVWDYENEIRYVLCGETNKAIKFPYECVSSVILGCEMELKHKKEIYELVSKRNHQPELLHAIKSPYSYVLSFEPYTSIQNTVKNIDNKKVNLQTPFRRQQNGKVKFSIQPDSSCPCGSGKQLSSCCLTKQGMFKAHSLTSPIGSKTSNSLTKCYASSLEDCSNTLSREHFVSESILNFLNINKTLEVGGFPWQSSEKTTLPPNALASNILCQRHNSALSALDTIAIRLFKSLDESEKLEKKHNHLYLFSGHDIERWLLKVLCGVTFSKNLSLDLEVDLTISKQWVEILFGYQEFPKNLGLYMCKEIGHLFKGPHGIEIRAISNNQKLTGLGLSICGYEFILSMSGMRYQKFNNREFVYRPFEIYTTGNDFEKSIIFSWGGDFDGGTISTNYKGIYDL